MTDKDEMIERIIDHESRLTDWERTFIDGMSQIDELTQSQQDKLTQIYNRRVT